MKRWIISFPLLVLLVIFSCKKDPLIHPNANTTDSIPSINHTLPDSIVYYDIKDTVLFSSPSVNTTNYAFDVNNDLIDDFFISVSSYTYVFMQSPHHETITVYVHRFEAIAEQDSIIVRSGSTPLVYKANDVIQINGGWVVTKTPFSYLLENGYFGFKKTAHGKSYCGWIKIESLQPDKSLISIKEYAINMTPGNSIRAGQKN